MIKTFESFYWKTDGRKLYESIFNFISKYWVIGATSGDKVGGADRPTYNTIYIKQHKLIEIKYCDDDINVSKKANTIEIKFTYFDKKSFSRSFIEVKLLPLLKTVLASNIDFNHN